MTKTSKMVDRTNHKQKLNIIKISLYILLPVILVFNIVIAEGFQYNGIVVKSGTSIYVFGNEIDGDIAALRKIVDNQEFYFSKSVTERIDYISEEDLDGLFVFDYLHTDENQEVNTNEI